MIHDLLGRKLQVGDLIILKNVEALPFSVLEIGEPVAQMTPGGMQTISTIKLGMVVPTQVLGEVGKINAMRVAEAFEMEGRSKVIQ